MMDKKYIKENNIIERYLLNQLSEEERQTFRVALLFDETLRQEVEDTRLLHQQIQQLTPQHQISKNTNSIVWLILGLFVVGLGSYYLYANFSQKEIQPPHTIMQEEKSVEDTIKDEPVIEESSPKIEGQEIKEDPPKEEEIITPSKQEKTTIVSEQPIASTDLAPHPYLEQFTKGAFRNGVTKVIIQFPKQNEVLQLKNGKAELAIKGKLLLKKLPAKDRFTLQLFSNQKADFDNFKPIISTNLLVRKEGKNYGFTSRSIIPLSAGLYYYIIEDSDIEDTIYVGKFIVEK